jgi:hypothetical protein
MSPQEFAEYVGIGRSHAYAILIGKDWPSIPRPEGYVYPFPSYVRRDDAWREAALRDYVDARMTVFQFAERIGVRPRTAEYILRGYTWRSIPRPEGFQFPWPGAVSRVA